MMKKLKVNIISLFGFLILLSCKPSLDTAIGTPKIQAGTAKLTGQIISPDPTHEENAFVKIFVPHTVSGEIVEYQTLIDRSGKFSIDIDLETDFSLIALYTSLKPHNSLFVKVRSGGVTDIDISYNKKMDIDDVRTKPEMSKYEMMGSVRIINEMLGIYDSSAEPQIRLYDQSPETYINVVRTRVSDKLKILNKDSLLSKELKAILARDFTIWRYKVGVFDYEQSMKFNFRQMVKDSTITPQIQKIDRSYFGFLKDLDLNNPEYLICSSFPDFQEKIFKNNTLALPEIADVDVPSWLAGVKAILSEVVGFKEGQYYDILAANAYGRQLSQEARPLTAQQKKNITDYWKEGEIAKILLRKNQQVVNK